MDSTRHDVRRLARLRRKEPALLAGRQYARPVSGNGQDFGYSSGPGGVVAYSRILDGREVVVVANTSTSERFEGWVLVDAALHDDDTEFTTLFSNHGNNGSAKCVGAPARFWDSNGSARHGWARRIRISLAPLELQLLARR